VVFIVECTNNIQHCVFPGIAKENSETEDGQKFELALVVRECPILLQCLVSNVPLAPVAFPYDPYLSHRFACHASHSQRLCLPARCCRETGRSAEEPLTCCHSCLRYIQAQKKRGEDPLTRKKQIHRDGSENWGTGSCRPIKR
jgi:hypothetical protein